MNDSRRGFLATAAAGAFAQTPGVQPITREERAAGIEKARRLMAENKLGAIFLEGGSSLYYFTGAWRAGPGFEEARRAK